MYYTVKNTENGFIVVDKNNNPVKEEGKVVEYEIIYAAKSVANWYNSNVRISSLDQ